MSDQPKQQQQQQLHNKPLLTNFESKKPLIDSTTPRTSIGNFESKTNSTQPPSYPSSSGSDTVSSKHTNNKPWRTTATSPNSLLNLLSIPFPSLGIIVKTFLGITVSLYILNQKHYLPKPLSRFVSYYLFWPTLPITIVRRLGKWETVIDDVVIMGGAPIGFFNLPEKLYNQYNVRGIINMCEEYNGPIQKYKKLGIKSLHLPTVDHFEPSIADMEQAIHFIQQYKQQQQQEADSDENNDNTNTKDGRVYIHCRAGHGRSAAVVMAWLLSKDPTVSLHELNNELVQLRNVRKTLWQQPNLLRLQDRLRQQQQKKKNGNNHYPTPSNDENDDSNSDSNSSDTVSDD